MRVDVTDRRPGAAGLLARLVAGGSLLGLAVAALTVDLEPELARRSADIAVLLAWGATFYGLAWLLVAAVPGLVAQAVAYRLPRLRLAARAMCAALALAPVVYALLLPQVGLAGDLLSHALFARGSRLALVVAAAAAALLALGLGATLVGRAARRPAWLDWRLLWLAAATGLVLATWWVEPPDPAPTAKVTAGTERAAGGGFEMPTATQPLLLLCIDGADPEVMRQLMAAGELPAFSRLAGGGTWGELATLRPTLSPVVWTTLITGRAPEDHGIHQFVHVRLPGVAAPILEFPLHSGLNFVLVRPLEQGLGVKLRFPYTTGMRRAEALWNVVGRFHRVGVYRWLMTWPAEEVDGYFVSGGIAWARLGGTRDRLSHPPELQAELESLAPARGRSRSDRLADRQAVRLVRIATRDPAVAELTWLSHRYRPVFTAGSFFPVDAGQHLFGRLRGTDARNAEVVDTLYRLADRRLGELLPALDPATRILVVSDHGYDFRRGHHGNAPPGVFFAAGDGIARGREVLGLTVYDVAPLVLRLLGLPLADDMPGTAAGRYRDVLDPRWAEEHPEQRIATWERGAHPRQTERLVDPEVDEVLRSLGYVE